MKKSPKSRRQEDEIGEVIFINLMTCINIQHIENYCIKGLLCIVHCHSRFLFFFYDGPVDMQIRALLARSQKRVSETQVTFKACDTLLDLVAIVIYGSNKHKKLEFKTKDFSAKLPIHTIKSLSC